MKSNRPLIEEELIKAENHLFNELPFGGYCPKCGGDVTFYNTAKNKQSGRYKCIKCSRDTVWAQGKALTIDKILAKLK